MIITNEDGTIFDPPGNPLIEKWDRLYPPTRNGKPCGPITGYFDDGRPIMNYTCVICYEEKCRYSNGFKVPEEDIAEYETWKRSVDEYQETHNPSLMETVESYLKSKNMEEN